MNKANNTTRAAILKCLTEGVSARATARLTGASRGTVLRLLAEVGEFVELYQWHKLRNLNTVRVEADEQWSFVGAKARNATKPGQGDLWTFCAIDADSKLVFSWLVGARSDANTHAFVADLAARLTNRVQLTTDGWGASLTGVRKAFDFARCDFAQMVKVYGQSGEAQGARRYSPMICTGAIKERKIGRPDMEKVSTSFVERFNLNTRQNCRRFTRLTNGFSKLAENHAHAVTLTFFSYNFCKVHSTLTKSAGVKTTPAMASGLTNRVWTWEDVLAMMAPTYKIGA
jgi:IS1 family transposase